MDFCFIVSLPESNIFGDVLYLRKNEQGQRNEADGEPKKPSFLVKSHVNDVMCPRKEANISEIEHNHFTRQSHDRVHFTCKCRYSSNTD